MDVPRCTSCRNPVKSHHARKQHPRTGDIFHDDCWVTTHGAIQADYLRRIEEKGLEGLLSPYVVTLPDVVADPVVPEQRDDDVQEHVAATVEEPVRVPAQTGPVERPLAEADTA